MIPVPHITDLSNRVMYFSGINIADTLRRAAEWGKAHCVTMGSYYVQRAFGGRSIIADYEVKG